MVRSLRWLNRRTLPCRRLARATCGSPLAAVVFDLVRKFANCGDGAKVARRTKEMGNAQVGVGSNGWRWDGPVGLWLYGPGDGRETAADRRARRRGQRDEGRIRCCRRGRRQALPALPVGPRPLVEV